MPGARFLAFPRAEPPIVELGADGKVVPTLGTKGVAGDGPDTFNLVCDIASRAIYVGETVPGTTLTGQQGGNTVRKLDRAK